MSATVTSQMMDFLKLHRDGYTEEQLREAGSKQMLLEFLPERANLIRWIPFAGSRVLEIGASYGALTGELLQQGATVDAIESNPDAAEVLAYRYLGHKELHIYHKGMEYLTETENRYDWILINGGFDNETVRILAKAYHYEKRISNNDQASVILSEFLQFLCGLLNPQGKILLACDNRMGMKYFATTNQEEIPFGQFSETYSSAGQTRFTNKELREAFAGASLHASFYYPYPDGIFPEFIYSDEHLPDGEELLHNGLSWDGGVRLFAESGAVHTVIQEGLFPQFASTYLCILQKEAADLGLAQYIKYSTRRQEAFAISTELYEPKNSNYYVKKRAFFPEGEDHIQNMMTLQKDLAGALSNTKFAPCMCHGTPDKGSVIFDYAEGRTMDSMLDELVFAGEIGKAYALMEKFFNELSRAATTEFYKMPEFQKVFMGDRLWRETPDVTLAVTDVDLIFANVICQSEKWWIIDYEWSFHFPVPFRFLMYRILRYYVYAKEERLKMLGEDIFRHFGLTADEMEDYNWMEEQFQAYVYGNRYPLYEDRQHHLPSQQLNRMAFSAEVFLDMGYGFLPEKAMAVEPKVEGDWNVLNIKVPFDCRALRLDPARVPGLWTIHSVVDDKGQTLSYRSNENKKRGQQYLFTHEDPHIIIPINGDVREVTISYVYDTLLPMEEGCGVVLQEDLAAKLRDTNRLRSFFGGKQQTLPQPQAEAPVVREDHTVEKMVMTPRILDVNIDGYRNLEKVVLLMGYAIAAEDVQIRVLDGHRKELDAGIRRVSRVDANMKYQDVSRSYMAGFIVRVEKGEQGLCYPLTLEFTCGKRTKRISISRKKMETENRPGRIRRAGRLVKKGLHTLSNEGVVAAAKEAKHKIDKKRHAAGALGEYDAWILQHEPDAKELELQRELQQGFSYRPKFSVVTPLYRTDHRLLRELIESIQAQTYDNWEICFVDAGADEDGHSDLTELVESYAADDPRIRYQMLESNGGIAENTNHAIEMATGDFIVFSDHDDTLAPFAMYECAKALNEDEMVDFIYSDQDMIDEAGTCRFEPLFKPDFSIDFLRCCNYVSHLHVVRKSLLDEVGYLDSNYDGSQDYDVTFRICEKARKIYHIPMILYHWRTIANSTAEDPATKLYAYENGKKAIDDHFKRMGIPATADMTEFYGKYHTTYHWEEKPLVSVVIANKDHVEDLDRCVKSLLDMSTYRNFEIVVVENNSEEQETFDYYEQMMATYSCFRVVTYQGAFNYSRINNLGVKEAAGEYVLLLNNDVECIDGNLIGEMLGYLMREDVGAVGARLFYEDETIQHAGVIIGYGNIAGHAFLGFEPNNYGSLARVICAQNYSAVTAACLMTKKSLFEQVGGLTEELVVAYNDVDYCLKIRSMGKLIVYNPWAMAYHYESKSRGYEDSPEKKARYNREVAIFRKRWGRILAEGDPYYSPNMTLDRADFSFRD